MYNSISMYSQLNSLRKWDVRQYIPKVANLQLASRMRLSSVVYAARVLLTKPKIYLLLL